MKLHTGGCSGKTLKSTGEAVGKKIDIAGRSYYNSLLSLPDARLKRESPQRQWTSDSCVCS